MRTFGGLEFECFRSIFGCGLRLAFALGALGGVKLSGAAFLFESFQAFSTLLR